jgi:type VI secretion system protein ImpB
MADLSGQPEKPLPALRDRKFVEVDKDSFDRVMGQVNPRVAFKVDNRLSEDDTKLGVELKFKSMADFEPTAVAKQVPALRRLLELRSALHNLRTSLIGNDKLESLLQEVLANHESLRRIAAEAGSQAGGEGKQED